MMGFFRVAQNIGVLFPVVARDSKKIRLQRQSGVSHRLCTDSQGCREARKLSATLLCTALHSAHCTVLYQTNYTVIHCTLYYAFNSVDPVHAITTHCVALYSVRRELLASR